MRCVQCLEFENARLREQAMVSGDDSCADEGAARQMELEEEQARLAGENDKLRQLYDGVLQETQFEQERAKKEVCELNGRSPNWRTIARKPNA